MIKATDIMTDEQVAELLGMHVDTFQTRCREGFKKGELDLLAADPIPIAGRRRWFRADVERVIRERVKA